MMNVLALSLVLTAIVTAGVFSPSPEKKKQGDDVIVKEGHRTVVVEYENDDKSNTRIFISPHETQELHKSEEVDGKTHVSGIKDKMEEAKEKLKEVASERIPDVGEGISASDEKDKDGHGHRSSPRELVCDAYGKCKHKIARAIGRTKDKVYEKASETAEKIYEVEEEVKEDVKEAFDKVKDTVREKSHGVSDKAYEAKEKVKDAGKEAAGIGAEKVRRGAEQVVDTGKTLKGDVEKNASRSIEGTKKKVIEKAKEAEETLDHASQDVKEGAHKLKDEAKKDLKEILHSSRVFYDAFSYILSPERMAASIGVLQLLGTATAFGMSIWVTFISAYVLAKALPRQQFAMIQSKIYPVYFKAMAYSIAAVLIGHLLSQRKRLSSGSQETAQGINLLASLLMDLVNLLILEPRATKVVHDRMKLEKEEGRGKESGTSADQPSSRIIDSMMKPTVSRAAEGKQQTTPTTQSGVRTEERPNTGSRAPELLRLSKTLEKLNSVSSFLNLLTLMALAWHLVHLGQTLHCVG